MASQYGCLNGHNENLQKNQNFSAFCKEQILNLDYILSETFIRKAKKSAKSAKALYPKDARGLLY